MNTKTINMRIVGAENRQIHVIFKGELCKVGLGITKDIDTSELVGKTVLIKYMKNDMDVLYAPVYMGVNEILTKLVG
jgi:hypothetical protein